MLKEEFGSNIKLRFGYDTNKENDSIQYGGNDEAFPPGWYLTHFKFREV